jgi:hypothetical protein
MRALIFVLLIAMSLNSFGQSTLGRSFNVKGKATSNDAYKVKAREAQLNRNIRLKQSAAVQLEAMRKRQAEQNTLRAQELATRKCSVLCTDQTLYFSCDKIQTGATPQCLNGEAAKITDSNGNVIGSTTAKTQEPIPSTPTLGRTEICTLSCPNGNKYQYACDAFQKPKCEASKCIHTCPGGEKKQYTCNEAKPICGSIVNPTTPTKPIGNTGPFKPTGPIGATGGLKPLPTKPVICVGEKFRCGYFTLNTCNTGGRKICPNSCSVSCNGKSYKQLCRLKPMACLRPVNELKPLPLPTSPVISPKPFRPAIGTVKYESKVVPLVTSPVRPTSIRPVLQKAPLKEQATRSLEF